MPWGESRTDAGTTLTDYGFTGQRKNSYIKLTWFGSRWYDSYLNQWNQPDTIITDQYNPQDWNRFSYARNNPLLYTDPSGHMPDDGCKTEGCSLSEGEEYHDYVYNVLHNNNERQENTEKVETAEKVIETAVSFVWEPADWVLTARDCLGGECSPLVLLGVLPFIPGNKVDDLVDAVKRFDPNQDALIQLGKEAKKLGGVTEDEVKILGEWASEYGLTFHGPEIHPNRSFNLNHIHLGPVDHIPVH